MLNGKLGNDVDGIAESDLTWENINTVNDTNPIILFIV